MKKIILLALIGFFYCHEVKSATTYTSASTGTVTVSDLTTWNAAFGAPAGSGSPTTYIISAGFTLLIGVVGNMTVDLSGIPSCIVQVNGRLGFYSGQKNLKLASDGTINVAAGGEIGYAAGANCCFGTAANTVTIGTSILNGPFNIDGPVTATQGNMFIETTFWNGNASSGSKTDWTNAGNWDNGLPTSTKNTIITDTTNNPIIPTGTTTAAVKKLFVLTGGFLTINSGAGLTVNDVLDNAGTITIKSGGSLVQTTNTLVCTGTFNVERAIPGGVSFISSPINGIGVNSFGITTTGSNGGQVLTNQTTPCNSTSVDPTSPYGNLMELHENATLLTPAANCAQELWFVKSAGTLTNGRGYSLTNGAATLNFTGTVNNGSVSYTGLTRQANANLNQQDGTVGLTSWGWHLVGNPYPSQIQITSGMLTGAGFDGQLHLYQHNGAYTGTWISYPPFALPVTIAVGQSFQIRKSAAGGTANFSLANSNRVIKDTVFYRFTLPNDFLQVTLNNGVKTDIASIFFYPGATDNFDPEFDANRLSDAIQHPMIYSIADNQMLSYNALPVMNPNTSKDVVIGVRTEVHGAHTLTFNGVNTLTSSVVLEDVKLGTFSPVTEGYVYDFTTVAGDNRARFILHFSTDATTGITTINNSDVKLFPNPVSGITSLVLPKNHGYNNATITDVCGKTILVFQIRENESTKTMDLKELTSGIYFIKLSGSSETTVLKLIKK